jgi:hypothetical protein
LSDLANPSPVFLDNHARTLVLVHDLAAIVFRYLEGFEQHLVRDVEDLLQLRFRASPDKVEAQKWHNGFPYLSDLALFAHGTMSLSIAIIKRIKSRG